MTEGKFVAFSYKSQFGLCAIDCCLLVSRILDERVQSTYIWPRHIGLTPGVMVRGAISYESGHTLVVIPLFLTVNLYVSLEIELLLPPFMNSTEKGVFEQDNPRSQIAVVTQLVL